VNNTTNIRQRYTPIQPAVKQSATDVTYSEFLPDIRLQNFIYSYWQLKTTQRLSMPFDYRVVADGCIDIYFELDNPQENYVMGFSKTFTEFPLGNAFNYIGICFLPTMFPQLFKVNAAELSNRYEHLNAVVPELSKFLSTNFYETQSREEIKDLLDQHFLRLAAKSNFDHDHRLYRAIDLILRNYGMIDIEKGLNTGISPRQLRRLFKFYVGDTAKAFSKVVRFQNILKAKPTNQSLRENKLFFGAGYYDQSHFIKEFKTFYGVTPSKAFKR
jgi:AraC-like DNA-binding protein